MLKVGIVGVGKFGENHVRILSSSDKCDLVGIYDKNKKRADEIGAKYQVTVLPDFDTLLNRIDALVIVVTTVSHYDLAKQAIERGIHTFIEKPITEKLEQAEELVQLADKHKVKLQVGHVERFNPIVLHIENQIKDPIFAECHRIAPFSARGSDVPVVLELMIHDIDLILAFMGSKVKDIRASGASVMTKSIDIANARLEFENGAVANVTASRISLKRSRKLRFFQKDSYFSMDFQNKKVRIVKKSKNVYKLMPQILKGDYGNITTEDVVDISEYDASDHTKDALTAELESFVDCIENKKRPVVDGFAGVRALDIALKIVNKIKDKG